MRHARRSPRQFKCRRPLCHECEEAEKAKSDTSENQGEQAVGFLLSPNAGKTAVAGTPLGSSQHSTDIITDALNLGIDVNDPTVQLANIIMELEDGCVERVQMSDNESAEEVAKKVCRKNDLPDQFVALLAEHIMDRYPQRPVDQPKEDVTENSEETKQPKSGKSPSESSNSRESKEK